MVERAFLVAAVALLASPVAALDEVAGFGSNPGALRMFEHASDAGGPRPLVVVLHGCTQTEAFATDGGFVALAEEAGFHVVVPVQPAVNNAQRCFNWFVADDIARSGGEAESILQMVDAAKARHDVDAERVFVVGVSAGAAMTAVLLADFPEVFAAGATFAGVPYGCGLSLDDALACMSPGRQLTQAEWAALVLEESGAVGPWPRISIWQGTSDFTVAPRNATALALQWTGVHGLPETPDETLTAGPHEVERWHAGGAVMVEVNRVEGLGHAFPVDPGRGCGTETAFVTDEGVCAAREALGFFGLVPPGEGEGEGEGDGGDEDEDEDEDEDDGAGCATAPMPLAGVLLALGARARRRRSRL